MPEATSQQRSGSAKSWADEVEEVDKSAIATIPIPSDEKENLGEDLPPPAVTVCVDETKSAVKKTWREALVGNRDASNGLKLRYVPLSLEGVVECIAAEVKPAVE